MQALSSCTKLWTAFNFEVRRLENIIKKGDSGKSSNSYYVILSVPKPTATMSWPTKGSYSETTAGRILPMKN